MCFGLYSILYDGWRIIQELLRERGLILKNIFKRIFKKSNPLLLGKGSDFYGTKDQMV